jgi:hypothetical protein
MPMVFKAIGTKRIVEDDEIGFAKFLPFLNLALSAALRT